MELAYLGLDYKLGDDLKTVSYSGTHTMLPYNLGWCDGQTTTYAARSVKVRFTQDETGEQQIITVRQEAYTVSVLGNNPFYQWGRKDPMLPSTGTGNTNKTWYDASGFLRRLCPLLLGIRITRLLPTVF